MKKIIELKNITKAFDGEPVLQNVNLDIYDNEFITLLGPSGCGKTTMLRLIAVSYTQLDVYKRQVVIRMDAGSFTYWISWNSRGTRCPVRAEIKTMGA